MAWEKCRLFIVYFKQVDAQNFFNYDYLYLYYNANNILKLVIKAKINEFASRKFSLLAHSLAIAGCNGEHLLAIVSERDCKVAFIVGIFEKSLAGPLHY